MNSFKHVCEVGYLNLETSTIRAFIEAGIKCTIIDVNSKDFSKFSNVTFHQAAIIPHQSGTFRTKDNTTFWEGVLYYEGTKILEKPGQKTFKAQGRKFSEFDKGDIDLLCLDIEGCELFVLEQMRSRPLVIRVEMAWNQYKNPFYEHILHWMKINKYTFFTKIQADYVFCKTG